jgi:hypothetical protein
VRCNAYSYADRYSNGYTHCYTDRDTYTYTWAVLTGPDRVEYHGRPATWPNDSLSCND